MKTKNLFAVIFGMAFLFLALAPISASTWFNFEADPYATSLTVNQGDVLNVIMTASSHNNIIVSNETLEAIPGGLIMQWNEQGTQSGSTYVWSKTYALDSNILGVGTYTLKFSATTNTGLEHKELTLIINPVDTTAPVITITGANPANVALGSVYNDAGATALDAVDGSVSVTTISNNVNTNIANTYQVVYQACDNSNNCATATRTVIVTPSGTDLNAPTITISSPTNGGTYFTTVTEISYIPTDAEGNLDQCWYSVDGGTTTSLPIACTDGTANLISGLNSVLGTNTWIVYASDTYGNIGSTTVTFTQSLDTTAPVITAVNPTDGEELDDTEVTLIVTLSEAGTIEYSIDGEANVTMTETSALNFESALLDLEDDEDHTVIFYATDLAGNTASLTIDFSIDEVSDDNADEYDNAYFNAEFLDTADNEIEPAINLTDDTNHLNWFQRFINWLCRLFGLEEVY